MKPLEEYMLFTKTEAEYITVFNSQGVRSAQCNARFEELTQLIQEPRLNVSIGTAKTWVEDAPKRIPYTSSYPQDGKKEEKTQAVFTILTAFFIIIIVCCLIEVYRSDRAHKRRIERETDESIILSREQAAKYQESLPFGPFKTVSVPSYFVVI